jgi:predicted ATPase/DNA-binding SARP family transcriptional activator
MMPKEVLPAPPIVTQVYARLMGVPSAHLAASPVAFLDDKRYQLLAYLAFKGDWVGREQLAYLFWPEVDTSTARKDLRHLLGRVRALEWLGDSLEIETERLRWAVATDVQAFKRAVKEARWEAAVGLYGGLLLEGFVAAESAEFYNWLETEREHLARDWRTAIFQQTATLEQQGKFLEAAQLWELLLRDEFDEEALKGYMLSMVRAGQRSQALRAYEKFSQRLLEELDLRPPAALEQLAQSVRGEDPALMVRVAPTPTPPPTKARPLPRPATPFVGRDWLLGEIARRLRGDYRLLSLVGPGGVGKTRIALQTALEHQERFADGVYFASLEALSSPTSLSAAIAEALGLGFQGKQEPLEQIVEHIAGQEMLLILDNFEHLLGAAPQVVRLLQGCVNLRVLVTSRERLGQQGEQVLPIEGFSIPSQAEALHSDVVRLFVQSVQRLKPHFKIEAALIPNILEICRRVEGFPLGVELAAAWARALPLEAIAQEIGENMDFLGSQSGDLGSRHHSIRAVFEHSWKLLTPAEQEALKKLSVFRGGFEYQAAKLAAGVSLPLLSGLVDKSLIQTTPEGRYFRHSLLYQYMQEKLAENPGQEQEAKAGHGGYYLRFLQQCLEQIRGPNPKAAFALMEIEFENLRSAWSWGSGGCKAQPIKMATEAWMRFFDAQKRYRQGIEVFEEALVGLSACDNQHAAAMGTLWVHQAKMHERLGEYDIAEQLTLQALELLRPQEEFEPIIWGLGNLAVIAATRGNHPQSLAYREEALKLAKSISHERLTAVCYGWLAISETGLGNYQGSKQHYREAIRLFKRMGNPIGALYSLNNLALTHLDLGELEEARAYLHQALELAQATHTQVLATEILISLGSCYRKLGLYEEATSYAGEALKQVREQDDPPMEIQLHITLGEIALAQGNLAQAKKYLLGSLEQAWAIQDLPLVMVALLHWAEVLVAGGKTVQAGALLKLLHQHPATLGPERNSAKKLLDGLGVEGEVGTLEEVVKGLLYG